MSCKPKLTFIWGALNIIFTRQSVSATERVSMLGQQLIIILISPIHQFSLLSVIVYIYSIGSELAVIPLGELHIKAIPNYGAS